LSFFFCHSTPAAASCQSTHTDGKSLHAASENGSSNASGTIQRTVRTSRSTIELREGSAVDKAAVGTVPPSAALTGGLRTNAPSPVIARAMAERQLGWVKNRNVLIEFRWAEGAPSAPARLRLNSSGSISHPATAEHAGENSSGQN
jgi:hypothetical protein